MTAEADGEGRVARRPSHATAKNAARGEVVPPPASDGHSVPERQSSPSRACHNHSFPRERAGLRSGVSQKTTHLAVRRRMQGVAYSRTTKPIRPPAHPHAIGSPTVGLVTPRLKRSVPEAGNPVLIKHRIGTHDRDSLQQTLSHKEPVKGVTVVEGQRHLPFGDLQRDRGHREAQISHCALYSLAIGQREGEFLEPSLDGEFPDRSDADDQFLGRFFEDGSRSGPKFARVVQRPDQGVGIEKMPQSMYSPNSSSGASKSGAM